ncbi:MAG: hypothetical protein ACKN9U_16090 [Pirellulaceae bacterium]
MIGPAKKLPVALCQLNNRGRLSVGRATAQSAESTNVLMEKTTKRYGEKGEEREFSPFLGVDLLGKFESARPISNEAGNESRLILAIPASFGSTKSQRPMLSTDELQWP